MNSSNVLPEAHRAGGPNSRRKILGTPNSSAKTSSGPTSDNISWRSLWKIHSQGTNDVSPFSKHWRRWKSKDQGEESGTLSPGVWRIRRRTPERVTAHTWAWVRGAQAHFMWLHYFSKGKAESESCGLQKTWWRGDYADGSFRLSLPVGRMTSLTSHLQLCQEFQGQRERATEFKRD